MAYKDDFGAITGLDYWWELDGDETDSVGSANSDGGTDPSWVTSIVPEASAFDCGDYNGTSSETLIPNQSDINSATTTQKTIHAWVYIDTIDTTGNGRPIWAEGGSSNGVGLYVYSNGGTPTLYLDVYESSTHDTISWASITTGTLYFITAVIDATNGNMYLYVNGSQVASKTGGLNIGSDIATHSAGVAIGGVDSGLNNHNGDTISGFFDGRIADVGYVAEATPTSLSDHTDIYNSGLGASEPTITDVDTDEDIYIGQTGVIITGTTFETDGANSRVRIDSSSAGTGTSQTQTDTSWSDTSVEFTASLGSLSYGTNYLFVRNQSLDENATGFPINLYLQHTTTTLNDTTILDGQTGVIVSGTNFNATQGTSKVYLCSASDGSGTNVEQTVTSWGDTSITFTVDQGALSLGTVYVIVARNQSSLGDTAERFSNSQSATLYTDDSSLYKTAIISSVIENEGIDLTILLVRDE